MESHFYPVWISSREHLERYRQIRDAPWYRVLFGGTYESPADFPRRAVGHHQLPIVFYAMGALTIAADEVTFAASSDEDAGTGRPRQNLDRSLTFSIGRTERLAILRFRSALLPSYFSIDWIELMLPGRSWLVCVGGWRMGLVRRRTDALCNALIAWSVKDGAQDARCKVSDTVVKGSVVRITRGRSCDVRLANDIMVVFSEPAGQQFVLGDVICVAGFRFDADVCGTNQTQGFSFTVHIRSMDVHDLRLAVRHGGSRTPTLERLLAP